MKNNETGEQSNIQQVEDEKDLGVTFQKDLKFTKHINNCVKKANRMIGIIKRTFSHMDKSMFLQLYKTMIRPYMEYATVVWAPFLKKDIFLLENTQRRATKLVKDISGKPYEERLKILGIPTLIYRRKRSDLIQVFKIINKIDNLDINTFFSEDKNSKTRGHNFKLNKSWNRLNVRANTFSQRVVNDWNHLSTECVNSETVNSFKSNLNEHWKKHSEKFKYPA